MLRYVALLGVAAVCAGCGTPAVAPGAAGSSAPAGYQVTLSVVGSGDDRATIAYSGLDGQVEQVPDAALTWSQNVTVAPGTLLTLTARSLNQGMVTCSIAVAGVPISKVTSLPGEAVDCSSTMPGE